MIPKTSFRLLCLCLFLCFLRPAGASDTSRPWNPKFTPAVGRAQAQRLARQYLGRAGRHLRLLGSSLVSTSTNYSAGEWRVDFTQKRGSPPEVEVVVAFRKGKPNAAIRLYNSPMER